MARMSDRVFDLGCSCPVVRARRVEGTIFFKLEEGQIFSEFVA